MTDEHKAITFRRWATVMAAGAVLCLAICALIGFVSTVNDKNAFKGQFALSQQQSECRSAAASFADTATNEMLFIIGSALSTDAGPDALAEYKSALSVASRNARVAQTARADAATKCTDDPTYRIDKSILLPIPPYPGLTT